VLGVAATHLNNPEIGSISFCLLRAWINSAVYVVVNVPDAVSAAMRGSLPGALYADDIHNAREIIGECVQGHFGSNLR
jgi:hypothetical protein